MVFKSSRKVQELSLKITRIKRVKTQMFGR